MSSDTILDKIEQLEERNHRVEADKAWETSLFRSGLVMVITYLLAALLLWLIGVGNYWLSAFVPTMGYGLSTLSLPPIKQWWIRRYWQQTNKVSNLKEE